MSKSFLNANDAFLGMLADLENRGSVIKSRNGGTKELLMAEFKVKNSLDRYITVPGRKVSLPAQIAETMWVLAGRNDVKFLSHYLPRAAEFSDDGKVWRGGYGPRLRSFGANSVDQLAKVVSKLRESPDTRQAVISIFDGNEDHVESKDIPCNNWLHFIHRNGELHLHVATRSNDLIWGWSGINNFEWSVLLEIVARLTGMEPGSIHYSITSLHRYQHHDKKVAKIIELNKANMESVAGAQIINALFDFLGSKSGSGGVENPLPTAITCDQDTPVSVLGKRVDEWFQAEALIREDPFKEGLEETVEDIVADPLFLSFAQCLIMWYRQDFSLFPKIMETKMGASLKLSPKPVGRPAKKNTNRSELKGIAMELDSLHREKNSAYGDSWSRRGEVLGIMANLARKVDRLGANGGGDTALDTSSDLLIYLLKYRVYLAGTSSTDLYPVLSGPQTGAICKWFSKNGISVDWHTARPLAGGASERVSDIQNPDHVTSQLMRLHGNMGWQNLYKPTTIESRITDLFTTLENIVLKHNFRDHYAVDGLTKDNIVEILTYLAYMSVQARRSEAKSQAWKAGNEKRFFSGYNDCE